MKKLIVPLIIAIFLWGGTALAAEKMRPKVWTLNLGTAVSGNTTIASSSAVSNFVISGTGMPQSKGYMIVDLGELEGEFFVFQISAVTVSQAQQQAGGDWSGVTVGTIQYRESIIDTPAAWEKATPVTIMTNVALSGATAIQIPIFPDAAGKIRFDRVASGVTELDAFTAIFKAR